MSSCLVSGASPPPRLDLVMHYSIFFCTGEKSAYGDKRDGILSTSIGGPLQGFLDLE